MFAKTLETETFKAAYPQKLNLYTKIQLWKPKDKNHLKKE
jgi:hypothetical protein